jgi:hypothetical protein
LGTDGDSYSEKVVRVEEPLPLLKSILTSLLVYALSFFKAPSVNIYIFSIESILNKFFGAGVRTSGKSLGLVGKPYVYVKSLED